VIDKVTVVALCSPAAVPMTIPRTSPIAQPVRQCKVAFAAAGQGTGAVPAPVGAMRSSTESWT
jgi:hypothetical protein